ncbi:MAG: T9SS type A sorting domain-containing protein [Bacteroidales bacterium]|nr:T9SS type A sorting domain-containing protein [Bacteroidales bacterium]
MKTTAIIVFYLILFLIGLALTGFSQGIENSGGYITGNSTSYITFSGGNNMTLKSTTADRTTLGNMTVDFTGSGTYKLTIPDDSYVTVDGSLTLSDTLLLKASSSSNMASLITNGTVTGAYAIVQQHIVQDQWHMTSSPVSSAQSGVYLNCYLYKWNEPDSSWVYISSTTENLVVTKGYHLWSSSGVGGITVGPTDVTFTGLLNTGNYSPTLSYNAGSNKGDGWNELGNPYPSALEWNSSWTKSNIDATIYIYDGTQYKTWNYNLGSSGSTLSSGEIPPTQGFWVKANNTSPSITIPNSERLHSSQSYYKGSESIENMFALKLTGNGYADVTKIGFYKGATNFFDSEYDAYKMFGIEEAPQLYTICKFMENPIYITNKYEELAVNILQNLEKTKTIPLGVKAGADGIYTMSLQSTTAINPAVEIYLEDKYYVDKLINLNKYPEYEVNLNEGIHNDRFVLHFVKVGYGPSYKTLEGTNENSLVSIYSSAKDIYVNYLNDSPATVIVYDILGKPILKKPLSPVHLNKFPIYGNKGYYIVKVISENLIRSEKVFIN